MKILIHNSSSITFHNNFTKTRYSWIHLKSRNVYAVLRKYQNG